MPAIPMIKVDNQKVLISLLVVIVIAVGCLGYFIFNPKPFTEFYVDSYPAQVILGEPVEVTMGVVNHEYEPTSYRLDIMVNGIKNKEISPGELAHEEEWQEKVSFTLDEAGSGQKVEFYLYKNNEAQPCFEDPLLLWIDVIEP
jgi:uncharacterized membrane protein